ncbi:MAG: alkaline phosphatase family protein [Candidatus Odinarchaeota archaeon]|nr:alkaline phosphatase family protein [Candidatus Odinarchaeota archaeon]
MNKPKVLVIGLDAAPPELLFNKFLDELPNIKHLVENGIYGRMKSCVPPITIPAWMVMVTSKNPGKLGIYGFRHRKNYSYTDIWIANYQKIKEKTVWNILSEKGKKSIVIGVPPTYPPKPLNGYLISCFITPTNAKQYTYPPEFREEIEKIVGNYIFDVTFRTEERDKLIKGLYEMTEKRFKIIKYLLKNKEWDFFMFVEIGLDRVQHAFWKFFDPEHHLYEPNSKYSDVIENYYKYLDQQIGELLKIVPKNTKIVVVSDHGAKRMKGALCINEWLIKEGYLTLKKYPEQKTRLEKAEVDWKKTIAWGWGGYYARIFLNVEGREPQGIIKPEEYEDVRDELAEKIKNIPGPNGEKLETKVIKPEEYYPEINGEPPDLMVFFDDLYWRSAGTIGHKTVYLPENDTGPDDAVHSQYGIYIVYDPSQNLGGKKVDIDILDVAPTIFYLLDMEPPSDMEGKPVKGV